MANNLIEKMSIDTIRMLGIEAVSRAKSGHPGIVLGGAPIMYALFHDHLNIDVNDLNYFNRDRFILSSGHGSALLYATMLVSGYSSINMDDLKSFRQLNSKTSGHPERILLPGVDVGTGPLGQGVAMAVGHAIAEAHLSSYFNDTNNKIIDHYTYCYMSDGDFEEGIFSEALSIAATYKLNKLILLYDSNDVQLDGNVCDSTNINVKLLCKAYNVNYILVIDGNNPVKISKAIEKAKRSLRPTLIEIKTIIGYGSSLAGSNKVHGSPLSNDEIKKTKERLKYEFESWTIPDEVVEDFNEFKNRGKIHKENFNEAVNNLKQENSEKYSEFIKMIDNKINFNIDWFQHLKNDNKKASRDIVGEVYNIMSSHNKHLLVLNNDLSSSTKVFAKSSGLFDVNKYENQNINMGVREFASSAISAGIVAHGGCQAVISTFLCFADYCKPAIRLSAINELSNMFVFSHDSITVGQDGPTHQPIEQLTMLRTIPNVSVFRPSSVMEAVFAVYYAMTNNKPTVITSSRSPFSQKEVDYELVKKGASVIEEKTNAAFTLVATGSEVGLALEVKTLFDKENINVRIVSMNSVDVFNKQSKEVKEEILQNNPIVVLELAETSYWKQFTKYVIGIERYGVSAAEADLVKYLKLTPNDIVEKIKQMDILK